MTGQLLEDSDLSKQYHQQSGKTILLIDHSKLNKIYRFKTLDVSEIDIIVTDQPLPKDIDDYCYEHDIEVIYE